MNITLNIVDLIENNPITRLSSTYQNKLLTKIKAKFTENEQQIFVASFYCYLNHQDDFVIDLDDIWKWLDFSTKQKSKDLLEKNFTIDKDYKRLTNSQVKQTTQTRGGHNKEIFMLKINTFKKFCLKAGTKKADEIHEYFIKLEEVLQEVIQEESDELKLQLEQKEKQLENVIKDKDKIRENAILEQFHNNTQCVYYGIIDNVSDKNEKLIKFGNSNNLKNRVITHRETYSNFILINAFKVDNKLQIENALKENKTFIERQRNIILKNKKYIELLNIEGLTFPELDKIIKDIITNIEFSPENYIKILEENKLLKKKIEEEEKVNNTTNFVLLSSDHNKLKIQNNKLIKKYNTLIKKSKIICDIEYDTDDTDTDDTTNTLEKQFVQPELENKINKIFIKKKDGIYDIDDKLYDKLCGSREEVWYCKAYKTSGGLIKNNLMENKTGKIISKTKYIQETIYNRFEKFGVNKPK